MFNSNNVTIQQFLLVPSGTYQNATIRPISIAVNEANMSALETATRGGKNFGIGAMQEVANSFIKPSASIEGVAGIANGWAQQRYRFFMKIREEHPIMKGNATVRILFGYTNYCDASFSGYLPPDLQLYFNSETTIVETMTPTPAGMMPVAKVIAANQIITPFNMSAGLQAQSNIAYLLRPEDIYSREESLGVVKSMEETGFLTGGIGQLIDTRTMAADGTYRYSRRTDASPCRYMSMFLSSHNHALTNMANDSIRSFDNSDPSTRAALMSDAAGLNRNKDISSCEFFAQLRDHAGYMAQGFVTYNDLCRIYPEAALYNQVTFVGSLNGNELRKINYAEQANHWNGHDEVTIAASLVSQIVPALMMDCLFRSMNFAVTNGIGNGQYTMQFYTQNCRALVDNLNMDGYFTQFEQRLNAELLNGITCMNGVPFSLSVMAELSGDIIIDISIGNSGLVHYVALTAADGLFSNMITNDIDNAGRVGASLLTVADTLAGLNTHQGMQMHPLGQPMMQFMPEVSQPLQVQQNGFGVTTDTFGVADGNFNFNSTNNFFS